MDNSAQAIVTFSSALAFGVLFMILSRKMRLPAIVLLLLGGIAVGPEFLGIVNPDVLGDGLRTIIALSVGLILFEGGLTLDIRGYRQTSKEIKGILTIGVLVTWICAAGAIVLIFQYSLAFALLAASLVIVTGPTVIGPLLSITRVKKRLHHILHWEGVLIDPIGVFIALLCYEWILTGGDRALTHFLARFLVGVVIGGLGGVLVALILKARWVSDQHLNIFVVAAAVALFALSDMVVHESGLLTVTVAGLIVGYMGKHHMDSVKAYKAELIDMLIGLLFVLLAANLELAAFIRYGHKIVLVVLAIMFVVRPLNIFASTYRASLDLRERLFLSWVAPRGIVAASMASLFALSLADDSRFDASFLQTFTYSVIAGTVLFQGLSTRLIGRLLGVVEPRATGWLVVGAHALGRRVAHFIRERGAAVVLVDTNGRLVSLARREGLAALCVNALDVDPEDYPELYGIGHVIAGTRNRDLNTLICQRWKKTLHDATLYRWGPRAPDDKQANLLVGAPIWSSLDPSLIPDVESKDERLYGFDEEVEAARIQHPERILLCAQGERILTALPPGADGVWSTMRFSPYPLTLDVQTNPHWIRFCTATTMSDALAELLGTLERDLPEIESDELLKQLISQEEEFSSVIGYDVALPHAYTEKVERSVVLVAKMAKPLTCQNTGQKISVIFLVLSPADQAQEHLRALAEISRFVMNEENRAMLLEAQSGEALQDVFFGSPGPSSGEPGGK